jgi:hypothetical protein
MHIFVCGTRCLAIAQQPIDRSGNRTPAPALLPSFKVALLRAPPCGSTTVHAQKVFASLPSAACVVCWRWRLPKRMAHEIYFIGPCPHTTLYRCIIAHYCTAVSYRPYHPHRTVQYLHVLIDM